MQRQRISNAQPKWDGSNQNFLAALWMNKSLAYGLSVGTSAVGMKYVLSEWGFLDGVSWGVVVFFVFYTVALFLLLSHRFSGTEPGARGASSSWTPYPLSRIRSYLTFLPITRVGQGETAAGTEGENGKFQDQNELSLRISIQKDLVIEAIISEYIAPWYTKVSSNTLFLQECREMLTTMLRKLGEKLRQVNRDEVAKEAIQTLHMHWKEYCEASTKSATSGENMIKCFKFVHPYLQDATEVSQSYEKMVERLLEEMTIPDLQSKILCHFLSGILVKSFLLYYFDLFSQPSWINNNLIILLSSDSVLAELAGSSSQNSSAPTTPLPDRSPRNTLDDESSGLETPTRTPTFTEPYHRLLLSERISAGKIPEETGLEMPFHLEKDSDSPLHRASPSPATSVSSALSGVIPATALPLLPAGSYLIEPRSMEYKEDTSVLSVDTEDCNVSMSSSKLTGDDSEKQEKFSGVDAGTNFKATTPTHYYSFEETSNRKSSHPMLDAAALSVDGALENRRKQEALNKGNNTHATKHADIKNSRSPVYEEAEDFATSIAKLRSLLEQKESKKKLQPDALSNEGAAEDENFEEAKEANEKETEEIAEPSDYSDMIRPTEKYGDTTDEDVPEPEIKCYFLNISIPKVEFFNDLGGGQSDFYCIQYEGVYFDEKYDGVPRKVILRTTTIKRRFKEFLLLQSRLEAQGHLKPHLKGIKAPTRWLNLSFSKSDAANTRRTNLERYLYQLCTHPVLGTTKELLQFMAYGDDGFGFGPLEINDPKHLLSDKLDKLAKKFTGVFNSLKDVIPTFDSNPPSPHSDFATPNPQSTAETPFPFDCCTSTTTAMPGGDDKDPCGVVGDKGGENDQVTDEMDDCKEILHNPAFVANVTVSVSDASPDDSTTDESTNSTTYPLAAALTQLLCDVLWLPNCRPHNASLSTFMSLSGKSLENYVQETIDVFLSDEALLGYLQMFHKSLKAETDSVHELQYDLTAEDDLKNCLRRRIPAWVRWMWGRNRLESTIERITGFFQNPIINQDLMISLSELLFSKLTSLQ